MINKKLLILVFMLLMAGIVSGADVIRLGVQISVAANSPPTIESMTPSSGNSFSNQEQIFITNVSDNDGWQNIQYALFLINNKLDGANASYLYYNQNWNRFYIRKDNNSGWLAGCVPGTNRIINNSYVQLNCLKSNISSSGNKLTVKWALTFRDTFTGNKNIYLKVNDDSGASTGWKQKGNWIINSTPTLPSNKIYVVSYVGDIDGEVSEAWFFIYNKLSDFYKDNNIPAAFSFYPGSLDLEDEIWSYFMGIYSNKNIELIQKGYIGSEDEKNMDKLSFEKQKEIIKKGQDYFKSLMSKAGIKDPVMPISYNQINGRFTEITKKAAEELGFKMYFDVFLEDDLAPVSSTSTFDSVQYGVSFTKNGGAGRETEFNSADEMIRQIKEFDSSKTRAEILTFNRIKVIPIWVHQQDFEDKEEDEKLDQNKWDTYTSTLLKLKNDPKIIFITPKELYNLRHNITLLPPSPLPNQTSYVCEYASSASATSENLLGSLAIYAAGMPDASNMGNCTDWSGYGYSWTPSSWNIKANLTLSYKSLISVENFSFFGDYDVCIDRIWLKNNKTGELKQVFTGPDRSCILARNTEPFYADTVIIETCGWGWTSTDAFQLCGKVNKTNSSDVKICDWKNCEKGAVSVSVDDYFNSCMKELEDNGYRGTYFLTNTNTYTNEMWKEFNDAFKRGHEIGAHTQSHICFDATEQYFVNDINNNINDIISHTEVKKEDLISHAYSCGFSSNVMQNALKKNWNFLSARGYNFNKLEESTPGNLFNLKSYNSHEYPGGNLEPPNYFSVIDSAEKEGKWANLVFHIDCSDDGIINYLPSTDLWVDTIGNVVKYIKLRDSAEIYDYSKSGKEIRFRVKTDIYKQELSLQISANPSLVEINNAPATYTTKGNYIILNIPSGERDVRIMLR